MAEAKIAQDRIYSLLVENGRPVTAPEVAEAIGAKKSTCAEKLARLCRQGRARRDDLNLGWVAVAP